MTVATAQPPVESAAPALGTSDHDKAMMAKVEGTPPVTPPASEAAKPQRPEGIPEKFWDAEKGEVRVAELAKSYSELEKGKGKQPDPEPKPGEKTPPVDDAAAAAEAAAKAAGADTSKVDIASLSVKYAEKGALEDGDYAALEKAGLGREVVDAFIAGQEALAVQTRERAYSAVGGQTEFDAMLTWAVTNVPQAERDAFDTAVVGSQQQRDLAIAGMHARFKAAVGSNPALVRGGGQAGAEGAYQSRDEVTRDMRDPRYKSDPAFRAQVERKLAGSSVF